MKGIHTCVGKYYQHINATYYHPPSGTGYGISIGYDVTNVVSITVTRPGGVSQYDGNPNAGGGFRVFPEKQTPTDTNLWNDRIKVTAKLNVAKAGVDIDFLGWDMDDPSSDDTAVDSNGPSGRDNRGGLGWNPTLSSTKTNANGEAYAVYSLSHQPGDNYRFSAARHLMG